jgi:hypothetical protein
MYDRFVSHCIRAGRSTKAGRRSGVKTLLGTRGGSLHLLGVVLLTIMPGIEGCALCHYGAHATLIMPTAATSAELPPPSEVLGDALRPLGFSQVHNVKLDQVFYEIGVGLPPVKDRVSVSWHPDSGLITIYDFRSFEASDLDTKVQDSIRRAFEHQYGKKLEFTPYPNKSSECLFGP